MSKLRLPAVPRPLAEALARRGEGLRILVVRLGAMGDVVRTLPAVRLVRRALPRARIGWVVDEAWGGVLAGHADVDRVLVLPRRRFRHLAREPSSWPELGRLVGGFLGEVREPAFDVVLDFHGNLRSGLIGWLSGAPVRVGYSGPQQKEGNRWWTTHRVPARDRRTPRMERNLDLVRALGLPDGPLPDGSLALVAQGSVGAGVVRDELAGTVPYAVLSPGASAKQAYKRPPPALLAAAARRLARSGVVPLVVWGPGEEPDARRVVDEEAASRLAPPTDLAVLAALAAQARLFVGGDSGPLHLACAVGCPVVGLYGPTDPRINGPWGVEHRVVSPPGRQYTGIKREDRRQGFEGIEPTQVETAVDEMLKKGSGLHQ